LTNLSIVTLDNLARFYTKIERNYVHQLRSVHKCAVWHGTAWWRIVNDARL
jgi:hypothetical protein